MAECKREMVQTGMRFGHLTCVEWSSPWPGISVWKCECDCGKIVQVSENALLSGVRTSCGCRKSRAQDLSGRRFGRLIALEPMLERDRDSSIRWLCRCDCGEYTVVGSSRLLTGHTESCGCMKEEMRGSGRTFVHGTCLEFIKSSKNRVNNTSGYKGVCRRSGKWAAYIYFAGRYYHLGTYDDIQEAAAIRQDAEEIRIRLVTENSEGKGIGETFAGMMDNLVRQYGRQPL